MTSKNIFKNSIHPEVLKRQDNGKGLGTHQTTTRIPSSVLRPQEIRTLPRKGRETPPQANASKTTSLRLRREELPMPSFHATIGSEADADAPPSARERTKTLPAFFSLRRRNSKMPDVPEGFPQSSRTDGGKDARVLRWAMSSPPGNKNPDSYNMDAPRPKVGDTFTSQPRKLAGKACYVSGEAFAQNTKEGFRLWEPQARSKSARKASASPEEVYQGKRPQTVNEHKTFNVILGAGTNVISIPIHLKKQEKEETNGVVDEDSARGRRSEEAISTTTTNGTENKEAQEIFKEGVNMDPSEAQHMTIKIYNCRQDFTRRHDKGDTKKIQEDADKKENEAKERNIKEYKSEGSRQAGADAQEKLASQLSQIHLIQEQTEQLKQEVSTFNESRNKKYFNLEELLLRSIIKLDSVEAKGNERIRAARKTAVQNAQKTLSELEAKVAAKEHSCVVPCNKITYG